ncbi:epimerase [Halothiobacillus diazotrophicus]|uniref:Epimerase n=1 Tax=Halothiobacillus diazotrophicus TaxID=1860122 RepID=A0A191ZIU1_9GAMM|nr:NAD-dependent epimerase/dehydratase family protein [Halothiobacillus diazotrophicus]ANJ67795.1 epimerase [Halothiobacillus diazotrophicus]
MNVLLTGASGFIGRNLVAVMQAAGHRIVPVSRRHGFDVSRMTTPEAWMSLLESVDAVVNAVGIIAQDRQQRFATLHAQAPIALFQACTWAGVRRVVHISALGANESAFSAYHRSKRTADDALRSLDLDWLVLRPALIYGRGGTSAELFLRLTRLPRLPVVDDGQQHLQPVHISDVIDTLVQGLTVSSTRRTLDLVGPQTVSFADWLQLMRLAQGLPPTGLLRIPYPFALTMAYLGRGLNPLLHPDNLRMLQAGYLGDPGPWTQFLGRKPRAPWPAGFFTDARDALTDVQEGEANP